MLRAHAWKDHSHPFVCAFCRQKPPANAAKQRDRTFVACATSPKLQRTSQAPTTSSQASPWGTRSLSTTALLYTSSNDGSPSKTGGFPGAFSGIGLGTFGSFASTVNQSPSSPSISDGLLPHEREARQRSAAATATQIDNKSQTKSQKHNTNKRGPNEAQATRSRSVLADVFKTNREPRPPPTPKSWSSGSQAPTASEEATTKAEPSSAATSPEKAGLSDSNNQESSQSSADSKHRSTGWGTFSHRKSETTVHPTDTRGNKSAVWSEITKTRRTTAKLTSGAKSHSHEHTNTTGKAPPGQGSAVQDFWGELETRATDFRDKSKFNRESSNATTKKDLKSAKKGQNELGGSKESTTSARNADVDGESHKPRRKSRFEAEEGEEEALGDRRSKKSKKPQKSRRSLETDDWDDEAVHRWEQKQRRKAEKEALKQKAAEAEQGAIPIFLPEYISASNLARALKQRTDSFQRDMEEMGFENITSDTIFTGETAALIAMEYGFEPTVDSGSLRDLRPRPPPEDVTSLPSRPPVVTIMGHVDHGKTTLLDWLRKSSVAAQEHGGITQHIGAFVVNMSSGKSITFLDTPGHAAFLSMRQRGANVTDIVVLVVAADDSVMPQTIEALKHATSAKVPIIVAITKVDKEDARVEQVKADLSRHGVEIEDYGGDVQVVCVSGKTGLGMEDLEENIVTLSEILDVRAENDGMAEGWILESSIKPQGKAATVLVKRGTLRPGDFIVAGKTWARIRVLRNEAGLDLDEAPPGTPVEILGWRELPTAGEQVLQSPDEGKVRTAVEYRLEMAEREQSSQQLAEQEQRQREKAAAEAAAEGGEETPGNSADSGIIIQNFTVKADVVGSVEAVCGTILELGNNEVRPNILRSSAGQITEYDVDHAATSKSVIVNFNCPIQPHIKQRAEEAKVKILDHNVIYHVVDDIKASLSALLPMNISFRVNGEADVLQVFPINVKRRMFKNIAGCRVRNGSIKKSSRVKVLRRGEVIYDGKIDTLKHVKKDVQEMGKGTECGIGLEDFGEFQADDQIQTYEEVREKRHLV